MKHILYGAAIIAVLLCSCNRENKQVQVYKPVSDAHLNNAKGQPKKADGVVAEQDFASTSQINYASSAADTTAMSASPIVPQSGSPVNPDWDKKIIKTANVTLELKDYSAYNNALHSRVRSYGAYIAQEQQTQSDNQLANEIVIKVPVDKFEDVMNSFTGEGIKVIEKNISTQDVTGEVVDTKARLEAKKQVRDRYLQLLKQANNMKDILDVQNEINTIQEDIESATGRVDYLVHSSAYSTINVKYYQYLNGLTAKEIEPTFFTKTSEAFKTGGEIITNIVLFFISIWPLSIAVIVLIIYLKRDSRKKKNEAQA